MIPENYSNKNSPIPPPSKNYFQYSTWESTERDFSTSGNEIKMELKYLCIVLWIIKKTANIFHTWTIKIKKQFLCLLICLLYEKQWLGLCSFEQCLALLWEVKCVDILNFPLYGYNCISNWRRIVLIYSCYWHTNIVSYS